MVEHFIKQHFSKVKPHDLAEVPEPIVTLHEQSLRPNFEVRDDLPVKAAIEVYPLPQAGHPDQPAMDILFNMLLEDTVRPLRNELVTRRKKALYTEIIRFDLEAGGVAAFVSVSLPYRRKKTARRHLNEAMDHLRSLNWADPTALKRARSRLLMKRYNDRYYVAQTAENIGMAVTRGGSIEAFTQYEVRLQQVTSDDLQRVLNTWFAEDAGSQGHFLPEKVPLWIRLFGWLYPLYQRWAS